MPWPERSSVAILAQDFLLGRLSASRPDWDSSVSRACARAVQPDNRLWPGRGAARYRPEPGYSRQRAASLLSWWHSSCCSHVWWATAEARKCATMVLQVVYAQAHGDTMDQSCGPHVVRAVRFAQGVGFQGAPSCQGTPSHTVSCRRQCSRAGAQQAAG